MGWQEACQKLKSFTKYPLSSGYKIKSWSIPENVHYGQKNKTREEQSLYGRNILREQDFEVAELSHTLKLGGWLNSSLQYPSTPSVWVELYQGPQRRLTLRLLPVAVPLV